MNMTDEQMRIAIAEACGWRQSERNTEHWHYVSEPYSHILFGDLPDYLNDLNAMHEAEELMLNNASRRRWRASYGNELAKVVSANGEGSWLDDFRMIRATARQRAIAFIKTLNLEPK